MYVPGVLGVATFALLVRTLGAWLVSGSPNTLIARDVVSGDEHAYAVENRVGPWLKPAKARAEW